MQALVLDGSRSARVALKRELQDLGGWPVHEAADPDAALALLAREPETDLVAVAATLPEAGVVSFVRGLRARTAAVPLRVLVLAEPASLATGRALLAAGADAMLARPLAEGALGQQLTALGVLGPA